RFLAHLCLDQSDGGPEASPRRSSPSGPEGREDLPGPPLWGEHSFSNPCSFFFSNSAIGMPSGPGKPISCRHTRNPAISRPPPRLAASSSGTVVQTGENFVARPSRRFLCLACQAPGAGVPFLLHLFGEEQGTWRVRSRPRTFPEPGRR